MEVGEDGNRDHARQAVRHQPRGGSGAGDLLEDPVGEDVLAIHAEAEARHRDPELRRRDIPILLRRIAQHRLYGLGQAVAARRAGVDRGSWGADNRELRGDEDAVEQDERGDDEERRHDAFFTCGGSTTADATASSSTASITSSTPLIETCSPGAGTPPRVRGMNLPTVSPGLFQSAPSTWAA